MIAQLLTEAWQAESAVIGRSSGEGRLLDLPEHRIYAGVEPGTERRFVAIRLDPQLQSVLKDRRPRSTRGIQTEQVVDVAGALLVLREQPGIPESVFPAVMEDVLGVAIDGERVVGLRRAVERFNSWQSAFERRGGAMTAAEVRGMIGELVAMRDVLVPACGAQRAVERWAAISDDEGLHDYAGEAWVLEAKSVLVPTSAFHVNAADQLQPGDGKKVWLCVVQLDKADDGESLNELLNIVAALMGPDPLLRDRFMDAAIKRGVRSLNLATDAEVRYRTVDVRTFVVGEGFPLIRRADIPLAIDNVEYDVDIVGCLSFEITRDELISALSQIEGLS